MNPRPASPGNVAPEEKRRAYGQFMSLDIKIPRYLPNCAIIPKPGKVSDMIWIVRHFQTLLMSGLRAVSETFTRSNMTSYYLCENGGVVYSCQMIKSPILR
jgi:hypothetical protein